MPIFEKKGHSVRNKKPHMNNVSTMPVFRKKSTLCTTVYFNRLTAMMPFGATFFISFVRAQ